MYAFPPLLFCGYRYLYSNLISITIFNEIHTSPDTSKQKTVKRTAQTIFFSFLSLDQCFDCLIKRKVVSRDMTEIRSSIQIKKVFCYGRIGMRDEYCLCQMCCP